MTSHAKRSRHPHWSSFLDKVNQVCRWAWSDHDDRIPSIVFNVLWGVALFALFVLIGLQ